MVLKTNRYGKPMRTVIYLCSLDKKTMGSLVGLTSANIVLNANDLYELNIEISKENSNFIYDLIQDKMYLYVERMGYFKIVNPPSISNDGDKEIKNITANSAECELMQYNLPDLKINVGSDDSYECLIEGNLDEFGIAKNPIRVYDETDSRYSLLDIVLKNARGWSVGEIDPLLANSAYQFSDATTVYTFLKEDLQQTARAIVTFDIINFKVNACTIENYGKNTNIYLSFRNLMNSLNINPYESDVYTRFKVQGANEIGIADVNFGSNYINNIDFYMKRPWIRTESTSIKYERYKERLEAYREEYINYSRVYAEYLEKSYDLYYRMPVDDVKFDWTSFKKEELLEQLDYYNTLIQAIEENPTFQTNGVFDIEILKKHTTYYSYICFKDIVVDIQYTYDHYDDDDIQAPKEWEKNWILYGVSELKAYQALYDESMKANEQYAKPWDDLTDAEKDKIGITKTVYEIAHNIYVESSQDYINCSNELANRMAEYENYTALMEEAQTNRANVAAKADIGHLDHGFTEDELIAIYSLYNETEYKNENIITTSLDDTETSIDVQIELLEDAIKKTDEKARPQFEFSVSLNRLLMIHEFEDFRNSLELGCFILCEIDDVGVNKFRVMSISYDLLNPENEIEITFSTMIKNRYGISDYNSILGDEISTSSISSSSSGSSSSGGSGSGDNTATVELIRSILKNNFFVSQLENLKVNSISASSAQIGTLVTKYIQTDEIKAQIGEISKLTVKDLLVDYVQADQLEAKIIDVIKLNADSIIANSGSFKELIANVADIKTLVSGNITADNIHSIILSADKFTATTEFVKNQIADKISAVDIFGERISTNQFKVGSDSGGLMIQDNTLTISDGTNVRIQMGRDKNGDFTFALFDTSGKGTLIDSTGIKQGALADNIISERMLSNGSVSSDAINWDSFSTYINEHGSQVIDIGKFDFDGKTLDALIGEMTESITDLEGKPIYRVEVSSSKGIEIAGSTILTAKVYNWNEDITDTINNDLYVWKRYRAGSSTADSWSMVGRSITITENDVIDAANFTCEINY